MIAERSLKTVAQRRVGARPPPCYSGNASLTPGASFECSRKGWKGVCGASHLTTK